MRTTRLLPAAFAALVSALACVHAAAESYIVFDAPPTIDGSQILPSAISSDGTVVGVIRLNPTSSFNYIGFVRHPDGTMTTFQSAPGGSILTVSGINDAGVVVGYDGPVHVGFTYDIASGVMNQYAVAAGENRFYAINENGDIAGAVYANAGVQSYVRKADGTVTKVSGAYKDVVELKTINDLGDAVGDFYFTTNYGKYSGVIMSEDGTQTIYSLPRPYKPYVTGINNSGTIAGNYCAPSPYPCGVFVRTADKALTTFRAPGNDGMPVNTQAVGLNNAGAIAGWYYPDSVSPSTGTRSFVRDAGGNLTTFVVPNQPRTEATAINDNGVITGYTIDPDGETIHGFIRLP